MAFLPLVPSIVHRICADSTEREVVQQLCRFKQNVPLSECIQPENLFPFTAVQWMPTEAETSDWRKSQKKKAKLHIDWLK